MEAHAYRYYGLGAVIGYVIAKVIDLDSIMEHAFIGLTVGFIVGRVV